MRKAGRCFTLMERNERVQCTEDLAELALRHDRQLQHGLVVHLVAHGEGEGRIGDACRGKVLSFSGQVPS